MSGQLGPKEKCGGKVLVYAVEWGGVWGTSLQYFNK